MFFLRHFTCLAFLLFIAATSLAQKEFRHFKVTHWDSRSGMPNDISLNIYQSKEGFIWLSGYSGLVRFDGMEFLTINSANDTCFKSDGITSIIYQTPDSTLWVATPGSGLIGVKNGHTQVYLRNLVNLVLVGVSEQGDLIIGNAGRLLNFNLFNYITRTYKELSTKQRDSCLLAWRKSNQITWLHPYGAVRLVGPSKIRLEQGIVDLHGDTALNFSNSYIVDAQNQLWVGSDIGIYQWVDGKLNVPKGLENESIIPAGISRNLILEDNELGIWIGTRNGVAYKPAGQNKFTFYTGAAKTKLNNIQGLMKDIEGNVWVASDKGLYKFSPSKFLNYTEDDGLINPRINSIVELSPGKFLFATRDSKLYELNHQNIRIVSRDTQDFIPPSAEIFNMQVDSRRDLWIGAAGFIFKFGKNGEKRKWILNGQARFIEEGIDGKMYFAVTGGGLQRMEDNNELQRVKFANGEEPISFFSSARQQKDGTWIMTSYGAGIMIGKENQALRKFPTISGVGGVQVFSSYIDKEDNIWFPTAKGLALLRKGTDSLSVVDNKDGMPYSSCFEVIEDSKGYFWLPTNLGVVKASRAEILLHMQDRSKEIIWKMLDESDGVINRQFVGARHSILSSDGSILFPNLSGLVTIDPAALTVNNTAPKLAINGILVDDKYYPANAGLQIDKGNHRYIITYSALSFNSPERVQIKFRLVGYDENWIISNGDRRAIYTNLPPGSYTFEVMAANEDGVWTNAAEQFTFIVKPQFYQTIWFKILAALALLGLIWLIVRWKTSATRQRNQELEKEVNKRTEQISRQKHELENMVNTLQSTQKQLIQQEKMASLGELTAGIAHEIQNPLNFINNFSELNKELIDELKAEADPAEKEQILGDIVSNLDKVLFHGKRADSIVKSMLQHSHSKTGEKEPTDINALADEYLRLSFHGLRAKDKNFQSDFNIDADPSVGQINIVRQDISRVLLNIINNAFYAVHDKAQHSGDSYKPLVSVRTKKETNKVVITIEDNGDGIPENIIHKIFQPFFTTKPTGQGTGLGLSMSYDIVKSQGGDIQVSSEAGKGSIFTIQLPA